MVSLPLGPYIAIGTIYVPSYVTCSPISGCRQDKQFDVADSQEFRPETVGSRSKKFKASRTDGIAA